MTARVDPSAIPSVGGVQHFYVESCVYRTRQGRVTTPFPKVTARTETAKVRDWLLENALSESLAAGDLFNAQQFHAHRRNPSFADADGAEAYLFGAAQAA